MKKIFNFRTIFFVFIFLWLGIIFSKNIFLGDIKFIAFFFVGLVVTLLLCYKFHLLKKSLVCLVAFCLGGALLLYGNSIYFTRYNENSHIVCGRVHSIDNTSALLVDTVVDNSQGKNILVNNHINAKIGDYVVFESKLIKVNLWTLGELNSSYYKQDITHITYVDDYKVIKNQKSLDESVKLKVLDTLNYYFDEESSSIAYAMIFGDTSNIEKDVIASYRNSGIAHILAVSGLHIGFLSSLLLWILKKLKVKPKFILVIISVILLMYCYLCSFSPSVVRASLMCTIIVLSSVCGRKYDSLSSVSLAGLLILLFKPLYAFDIGFRLSFLCVFAIILLQRNFSNILLKMKCPKTIASSISMCLSTTLGILPIQINVFNKVNVLSLISNLICIPIFSVAFTLLIIFLVICLILPFLNFLLHIPNFLIRIITSIASFIDSIPFSVIEITESHFLISIIYLLLIFFISSLVFLSFKNKVKLFACFMVAIVVFSLFTNSGFITKDYYGFYNGSGDESYFFKVDSGTTIAVVLDDNYMIEKFFKKYKISKIDYLITKKSIKNEKYANILSLNEEINIKNKNFEIQNIKTNTRFTSIIIKVNNTTFKINYEDLTEWERLDEENKNISFDILLKDNTIEYNNKIIKLNDYSNFTFSVYNDKIKTRSID